MPEEASIFIRLSEEDKRLAEQEADKLGLSVAAFMRLLLKNWTNGITFQKDKGNNSIAPQTEKQDKG